MTTTLEAPPQQPAVSLWQASGGARYAVALVVDALGTGLLRPFLLLYAVLLDHTTVGVAGIALSGGLLAGLGALRSVGNWIDRGARRGPVVAALAVRALGLVFLLSVPGVPGFCLAAVLVGVGSQVWPMAHAAVISSLAPEGLRDAALAATRSLRNAGMGAGALLATVAVSQGSAAMRWCAVVGAASCLLAAAGVASVHVSAARSEASYEKAVGTGDPLRLLMIANLPYALCFDVLEVALPALLVTRLHASPAWSSLIFVGNTLLVIVAQVAVVRRLARHRRQDAFAGAGLLLALSYLGFLVSGGPLAIAVWSVVYTFGEIVYAGVGTALVVAAAPPHLLGRALARWQLSSGLGRACAPLVLTTLLGQGSAALWLPLAIATAAGGIAVRVTAGRASSPTRG